MTDHELDTMLKSVPVPERPADYWERFPKRVLAKLHWRQGGAEAASRTDAPARGIGWGRQLRTLATAPQLRRVLPALALGTAAVCVLLGFALGFRQGQRFAVTEPQLAQARKCFQEIEGLFPNQVRAIVFDQQRSRLVLSEQADVPTSPPLYVKISGPHGCLSYVTFSGQQIRINGDVFDVLVDRQGDVLLVGRNLVWSSGAGTAQAGAYRITAKPLEVAS
jgi:hypothetical protein